jgi:CHASE3 domain sensor protein
MDIAIASNVITITGNIKSVSDYQKIKESVDRVVSSYQSVVVDIKDSISITSSIIGYFTKLVQKEGVDLSIKVGDQSLMELFEDLNLVSLFKVRKV